MAGPQVEERPFGALPDGRAVAIHRLASARGLVAEIATLGGTVVSLHAPGRGGRRDDVVLGHDALAPYLAPNRAYLGALVGRYANRIAGGRFVLGGRACVLARNDGANHLHGGVRGFDQAVWSARPRVAGDAAVLELRHVSPDGDEGYPGELSVTVTITVRDAELELSYLATTTATTVCNLTHHGYFNLDGAAAGDVLGHRVAIHASRFTPIGAGLLPTGELREVAGTPLDLRRPARLGDRVDLPDAQLVRAGGFDHNWVLDRDGAGLAPAARLAGASSGRVVEVLTTEPGLQLYSGNFLDGTLVGKGGVPYRRRAGVCLETQHFPDSPNRPAFPSTVLEPGEAYRSTTVYRFSVED